jgi:hypothetical protein
MTARPLPNMPCTAAQVSAKIGFETPVRQNLGVFAGKIVYPAFGPVDRTMIAGL